MKDLPKWKEWLKDDSHAEFERVIADLQRSEETTSELAENSSWCLSRLTEDPTETTEEQTTHLEDIFLKDQQTPQVHKISLYLYTLFRRHLALSLYGTTRYYGSP